MGSRHHPASLFLVAVLVVGGVCLAPPTDASAQDPAELRREAERRLGRPLTDREILRRLRESGLTPAEVRARLQQRGYSGGAADPWLQALDQGREDVPEGTSAIPVLSVLADEGDPRPVGRIPSDRDTRPAAAPGEERPPVFGRALFRRATSQFRPVTTGPVPPDYRVGPDDHLQLVLTGGVEQAYDLTVDREGWIVVPDVGQVFVNGRTLDEVESSLRDRLSQVYSGLDDGATRFDVSLGELRRNQVYVIGEVEEPAAYAVSSLATALTALYHAAGPTRSGSFREVRVNRGGETVATLDLYEYLMSGRADDDVRLEHGDVVFVPVAGDQVTISGPVTRPGIYELHDGETLADALRYAGGVDPTAELRRVQIHRILPPEERAPGRDRAVLDVPVEDLAGAGGDDDGAGEGIALRDGDRIEVFAVLDAVRNAVTVSGGVWRPGVYGVTDGTRLWDVIEKAGGLLPDVYEGRAQIQRLQPDHTRRMIPVSLSRDAGGEPAENPRIRGMDQVFVFARRALREERAVSVGGWVREPGTYPHVRGMTVKDLLLQAGGLRTGAYRESVEVSRVVVSQTRTDTLTRTYEVALDGSYDFGVDRPGDAPERDAGSGGGAEAADDEGFELRNMDAVYVRRAPGFEPQRSVVVTGEVLYAGPYPIRTRADRISDIVRRAGGLTAEAYVGGFQLWRMMDPGERPAEGLSPREVAEEGAGLADSLRAAGDTAGRAGGGRTGSTGDAHPSGEAERRTGRAPDERREPVLTRVGIDFEAVRSDPGGPADVHVQPGDSIHVPRYDETVTVRGAVGVTTRVVYRAGAGLDYYIDQAGGYAQDAAEDRARVRYANGEIETRGGGFLFFGGGVRDPDPGSEIFVPRRLERDEGLSLQQVVGIVTSVASAAATIAIAVTR